MAQKINYDRLIGPSLVTSVSDETTTTLAVTSESAPTSVQATNYCNFVVQVSAPGSTTATTPATCTDTQGGAYSLIKELSFAGYALDIFSHIVTTPNVSTTVTVVHQPSKHRVILSDEWYNVGSLEHVTSAFATTATYQVDSGQFHVGQKHWLVYAVLALGGSPHDDGVSIPDDWYLLHDVGSNYGDGIDVRLITCYQIAHRRKKVDFRPIVSNPRVWGAVMFAFKEK